MCEVDTPCSGGPPHARNDIDFLDTSLTALAVTCEESDDDNLS
jgi:hypothetical protein